MSIYLPMGYLERRSCALCGKKFKPTSKTDRYCSASCMRRRFDAERVDFSGNEAPIVDSAELREMAPEARIGLRVQCANVRCHKVFVIGDRQDGRVDKRTRFCCVGCEKQYWRDVTRHPDKKEA